MEFIACELRLSNAVIWELQSFFFPDHSAICTDNREEKGISLMSSAVASESFFWSLLIYLKQIFQSTSVYADSSCQATWKACFKFRSTATPLVRGYKLEKVLFSNSWLVAFAYWFHNGTCASTSVRLESCQAVTRYILLSWFCFRDCWPPSMNSNSLESLNWSVYVGVRLS